jgi:Putative peptidoglycan binding domain
VKYNTTSRKPSTFLQFIFPEPFSQFVPPNKSRLAHVKPDVKQLFLTLICTIATVSLLTAQNASPGNSPAVAHKPKPVRVAPKQQPNVRAPVVNPPARPQLNLVAYSAALSRYQHARHTHFWWKNHFTTIVLVGGGYYYWDAGYWFPAWGYDPSYESYDYDGPIFTYGNLLPDQVVVNVQRALQNRGYYDGGISGALSPATRRAISAFQQDEGLEANGVIDGPTVYALGLI